MKKLLLIALLSAASFAQGKEIVIYHTSDAHGFYHAEPDEKGVRHGGYAAVKNMVDRESAPTLLLDSGDYSAGAEKAAQTKGALSINLMNRTGYQAAAIGNHESAYGEETFLSNIKKAKFPILNASITDKRTGALLAGTKPYVILNAGGVKVAVTAIGTEGVNTVNFEYNDPIASLKKVLKEIKEESPAVIVLLIHGTATEHPRQLLPSALIAKELPEINIILGGHNHFNRYQNYYIGRTLIAEPGYRLKTLSKITVEINDKTGDFTSAHSELLPV